MSELRSWFLRNVLEAAERQLGAPTVKGLCSKLSPRLSALGSLEHLRACATLDTVPLSEGAELLLSVDSLLGDGSGKLLENIGVDLAARVLSQGGSVARAGDLAGTVARLQAFLEHPFVGVPLVFELRRTAAGFSLTVGVTGHSRATRAVRHLTIGAIIAAERFAREVGADNLTISGENTADRSTIHACYLPLEEAVTEEQKPRSRRPIARKPANSLSAEVERILRSTVPPRTASNPAQSAIQIQGAERPRSSSQPPPPLSRSPESDDPRPPESMTLRVAPAAAVRDPAIKRRS